MLCILFVVELEGLGGEDGAEGVVVVWEGGDGDATHAACKGVGAEHVHCWLVWMSLW